ncbi:MAG: DUF1571 domain-containing protein [Planctomycetia bacterium]|nr:DUF1571 domain-containing protein [Planctomycetia bacterium]
MESVAVATRVDRRPSPATLAWKARRNNPVVEFTRMVASLNPCQSGTRRLFRRVAWAGLAVTVVGVAFASWWLTEPLTDHVVPLAPSSASAPPVAVPAEVKALAAEAGPARAWPEGRLDGRPAKTLLLDVLVAAAERLNRVESYTATFHKQERLNGTLGAEQTLAMKVRQKPFAIYFKFLGPQAGKEVVYAEGHHDNKLIAHSGGVARFLVPRLAVPPDHPLALSDSRHPITEAGLANLTTRLIHFRRIDLDDPRAVTVLDRTTDAQGHDRLRSVHVHPNPHPDRPFARIEVLYDPDTFFPLDIRNYDWPQPGRAEELPLVERYTYEDLDLEASLTALDFDPANPAYAFHRY